MKASAGAEPTPRGPSTADGPRKRGCLGRLARAALLLLVALVGAAALHFGTAEALARLTGGPPPPDDGEVVVWVTTNGVHVSLLLPVRDEVIDWGAWIPPVVPLGAAPLASFGWGDEGFYTQVPTWADLTPGVALRATLWRSPSALHVFPAWIPTDERVGTKAFPIGLDRAAYRTLVEHVKGTFRTDEAGRPVPLDHPGYGQEDRFFAARGSYHLLRTCNEWVSDGLRTAGVAMPAWTPYERNVLHRLRRRGEAE